MDMKINKKMIEEYIVTWDCYSARVRVERGEDGRLREIKISRYSNDIRLYPRDLAILGLMLDKGIISMQDFTDAVI